MAEKNETPVAKKEVTFLQATVREIIWQFWSFFVISINKADFDSLPTDSSGYVKLTMNAFKNWRNEYGNTHYLTLNNYVKKQYQEDERL